MSCPRWEWALQRNRTRCLARKHPRWQSAVSVLCPEDAGRAIPEKRAVQPFLPRAHLLQGSVPETTPQAQQRLDVSALSFHLPSCREGTVHCLLTSSALIWATHRQMYENNVSQRLFRVSAYFSISSSDFYCWAFLGFVCFILLTASALKKKKNSFALLKASSWVWGLCVYEWMLSAESVFLLCSQSNGTARKNAFLVCEIFVHFPFSSLVISWLNGSFQS